MNRRSLFRSLIGLPLLPFAAKAVAAAPTKSTPKPMQFTTAGEYTVPVPTREAIYFYTVGGDASGGYGGGPWSAGGAGGICSGGGGGAGSGYVTMGWPPT